MVDSTENVAAFDPKNHSCKSFQRNLMTYGIIKNIDNYKALGGAMNMKWVLLAFASLFFISSTQAAVVDQWHSPSEPNAANLRSIDLSAQSFTVGITGTITRIDVLVDKRTGTLPTDFFYFNLVGAYPLSCDYNDSTQCLIAPNLSSSLVSLEINENQVPQYWRFDGVDYWTSIDLSAYNIYANTGDEFAIVMNSDITPEQVSNEQRGFNWFVSGAYSGYTGGDAFQCNSSSYDCNDRLNWGSWNDGRDFGFRVWVEPVPIPPAIWLFGSGFFALVSFAKRNKVINAA